MDFLLYSEIYMPVITIICYLFLKQKIDRHEKLIFFYCWFSVALYILSDILALNHIHNLFVYNIYNLSELLIIAFYVYRLIFKEKPVKHYFIAAGVFVLLWILNVVFFENFSDLNVYSTTSCNIILLFLCMFYIFNLSGREEILYFQKLPSFWIVSGFLIYSALSLMVNISYQYFLNINQYAEADAVWTIIFIAIIIKFILISVGLLCYTRRHSIQHLSLL